MNSPEELFLTLNVISQATIIHISPQNNYPNLQSSSSLNSGHLTGFPGQSCKCLHNPPRCIWSGPFQKYLILHANFYFSYFHFLWEKQLWEKSVYLACTVHNRGKPSQGVRARTRSTVYEGVLAYLLACSTELYSACFLIKFRAVCTGMVPSPVGCIHPHHSIIKKMPYRHGHRPMQWT